MLSYARLFALALPLSLASSGCAVAADPGSPTEPAESTGEAIKSGTDVSSSLAFARSTVRLLRFGSAYCTGIIIGPRHVLSAAHCKPRVDDSVQLYVFDGTAAPPRVQQVYMPWGVDPSKLPPSPDPLGNWDAGMNDTNGKYADIVVLVLDRTLPATTSSAIVPDMFIGNGDSSLGYMVGGGIHDGRPNPTGVLRYAPTKIYSSNNLDGHFLTDSAAVDPGDSGGPFYTGDVASGRLIAHGSLSGTRVEWAQRAKYTSLSYHVDRILWGLGERRRPSTDLRGGDFERRDNLTARQCALACMQHLSCVAYTHVSSINVPAFAPLFPGACWLKGSITTGTPAANMTSGIKDTSAPCTMQNGACRF